MKIKIDNNGWLWIERAGKFKAQGCSHGNEWVPCGDWCPKFGEPKIEVRLLFKKPLAYEAHKRENPNFMPPDEGPAQSLSSQLSICRIVLLGKIIDERQKGGSDEK